jgi:hypothetical protein
MSVMTTNNLKAGKGATLKVPYILNVRCTLGDVKNKNTFNSAVVNMSVHTFGQSFITGIDDHDA